MKGDEATVAMLKKWDLITNPPAGELDREEEDRGRTGSQRRPSPARSMPSRSKSRVRLWKDEDARQDSQQLLDSDCGAEQIKTIQRMRRRRSSSGDGLDSLDGLGLASEARDGFVLSKEAGPDSEQEERCVPQGGVGMSQAVGISSVDSFVVSPRECEPRSQDEYRESIGLPLMHSENLTAP